MDTITIVGFAMLGIVVLSLTNSGLGAGLNSVGNAVANAANTLSSIGQPTKSLDNNAAMVTGSTYTFQFHIPVLSVTFSGAKLAAQLSDDDNFGGPYDSSIATEIVQYIGRVTFTWNGGSDYNVSDAGIEAANQINANMQWGNGSVTFIRAVA